jgi:hypothetical protein
VTKTNGPGSGNGTDPLATFTARLRECRVNAGDPSLANLEKLMGDIDHSYSKTRISSRLAGRTKPEWPFVEGFVRACARYAGYEVEQADLDVWRDAHKEFLTELAFVRQSSGERKRDAASGREELAGKSADAAFRTEQATYLRRLRQRYRVVDHMAVLAPRGDDTPALGLREVFVAQNARSDPPPVELPRETWRRLVDAGDLSEREVPGGVDREQLSRALKAYQERPQRPVLDVVAGHGGQKLVLLGYPGAGKSTLAKYVMLALAELADTEQDSPADHPLASLAGHVPLLVELRSYAQRPDRGSFLEFIELQHEEQNLGISRTVLEPYLERGGRGLVIFDGLDEVFDPKLREQIKRQIDGFADRYPRVRVIATSRVTDYDRGIFDNSGFAHFMLQDLTHGQISEFAQRFYAAAYADDRAEGARLSQRLLDAVRDTPGVAELAGNPMLLTILAIIGRGEDLPRERRTAYQHAVSVLVDRWDADRYVRQQRGIDDMVTLTLREKLELLRLVARRMQQGADGLAGNSLPGAELAKEFSAYFMREFGVPKGMAERIADTLLDQLRERDYILARFGVEQYGFVHRAFLDYLAADDIYSQFFAREIELPVIQQTFSEHWTDQAWQEVLLLLAGMLGEQSPGTAGQAIDTLLASDPLWYQSTDPLPRHVVLAIRCLAEVRRRGRLSAQSSAIAAALISLLETVSEGSDSLPAISLGQALEREALPALVEYGPHWTGRPQYENWYLCRGQFLGGESPGFAQATSARIYVTLLGRDGRVRDRLCGIAQWADFDTIRVAALEALAAGWHDAQETAELIRARAASDRAWYVRREAVRTLAAGWHDEATRNALIQRATGDPDPAVRSVAVRALAAGWRDEDTADLLIKTGSRPPDLTGEQHADVRAAAVQALAAGWHDDSRTAPWLWERVTAGEQPKVRAAATEALAAGWPDDSRVAPWLLEHAAADADVEVRVAAVRALAAGWPDDPGTAALLRTAAAGDPEADVRRAAVEAVAVGGRKDTDTAQWLGQVAAGEQHENVLSAVVQALAAYWDRDSATAGLLRELAESKQHDWYVRAVAVQAFAHVCRGRRDTAPWLRERAERDEHWYVRRAALRAVAAGWHDDEQTCPWLRSRAVADTVDDVRGAAVQAVAAGWHSDPDTFTWLCAVGDDNPRDSTVRRVAVQAVAAGWRADERTLPWMRGRAESDPRPEVRRAAVQLLAAWWHDDAETVPWLRQRAEQDRYAIVRSSVVRTLSAGWPADPQTSRWLRDQAFGDKDQEVRVTVIRTLSTDWHDDAETARWLMEHAHADRDKDVRQAAVRALVRGWIDDPAVGSWLDRVESS